MKRTRATAGLCALCALFGCAFGGSTARASKGVVAVFGATGAEDGQFGAAGGVGGVAVNDGGVGGVGAGDVYVADRGNNRVERFSAAGAYQSQFGASGSGAGQLIAPQGVAIDQSTGNVYVSDQSNRRVDVFSATGVFEGAWGWGAATGAAAFEFCSAACHIPAAAGGGAGQFGPTIGYPAVDPATGNVYVADSANRRLDEFSVTLTVGVVTGAEFVRGYGWGASTGAAEFQICTAACHAPNTGAGNDPGHFGGNSPSRVAVDNAGAVYASDVGNARVQKFDSSGNPLAIFATGQLSGSPTPADVAVNPAGNRVFVVKPCSEATCPGATASNERRLFEFDTAGTLVDTHAVNAGITLVNGVAVAGSGDVYLSAITRRGAELVQRVFILNTLVTPTVEIEPPTGVTASGATLHGTINPNETAPNGIETRYQFEYSTDEVTWTKAPAVAGTLAATSSAVAIDQAVNGLDGGAVYHVRLHAEKDFGAGNSTSSSIEFTTSAGAPAVANTAATGVTDTTVTLSAQVNPENQRTTYHFEYGTTEGYGRDAPIPDAIAGFGPSAANVTQPISGLQPGTTYHFRVVATNPTGPTEGPDASFTTNLAYPPGIAGLPDGRAYEQVTPVNKDGTNPAGFRNDVQASGDGERIVFLVPANMPGAGGSSTPPLFLASRGAEGWSSQGLLPPSPPGVEDNVLGWSEDLSQTALQAQMAADASPGLYLRDAASGAYRLAAGLGPRQVRLAGFSADDSHVLFETAEQLLPSAEAGVTNLYELNLTTDSLRLAGVLDDSSTPVGGSFAGPYNWAKEPDTSTGGATAGYYTQNTISSNGSRVFFTAAGTGKIYAREPDAEPARTIEVSSGTAEWQAATPDGRYVLYTEGEALFRFDLSNDTREELAGAGAEVQGTLGISADGSHAYFVANGVLSGTSGASPGTCHRLEESRTCNLYEWDGTKPPSERLSFIASQSTEGTGDANNWLPRPSELARTSRVTPDGKTLLFVSRLRLTAHDNAGFDEYYRFDATRPVSPGNPLCVTCNPTGAPAAAGATLLRGIYVVKQNTVLSTLTHNLSDDGDRVFFETTEALVSRDTNNALDVYEWEREGAGSCTSASASFSASAGGCLYLTSTGRDPNPSNFADASANGDNAFFFTSESLVGQDRDQLRDVYDARVGGGIPAQSPSQPAACNADTCRGPSGASPVFGTLSSSTFAGTGNVVAPGTSPAVTPISKTLTAAQKRAAALKACKRKQRKKRAACVKLVKKRYASKSKTKPSSRRGN